MIKTTTTQNERIKNKNEAVPLQLGFLVESEREEVLVRRGFLAVINGFLFGGVEDGGLDGWVLQVTA